MIYSNAPMMIAPSTNQMSWFTNHSSLALLGSMISSPLISAMVFVKAVMALCLLAAINGVLFGIKVAQKIMAFICKYGCSPFIPVFTEMNAGDSTCIRGRSFGIFRVFRMRRYAKVLNSIVRFIAVYVINVTLRPISSGKQPSDTMRLEHATVYTSSAVPRGCGGESSFTSIASVKLFASPLLTVHTFLKQIRRTFAPKKIARLGVVPQDRHDKLIGWNIVFHNPMVTGG